MSQCPKCGTHFKALGTSYYGSIDVLSCRNGHTPETVQAAIVRAKESQTASQKYRQALIRAAA